MEMIVEPATSLPLWVLWARTLLMKKKKRKKGQDSGSEAAASDGNDDGDHLQSNQEAPSSIASGGINTHDFANNSGVKGEVSNASDMVVFSPVGRDGDKDSGIGTDVPTVGTTDGGGSDYFKR